MKTARALHLRIVLHERLLPSGGGMTSCPNVVRLVPESGLVLRNHEGAWLSRQQMRIFCAVAASYHRRVAVGEIVEALTFDDPTGGAATIIGVIKVATLTINERLAGLGLQIVCEDRGFRALDDLRHPSHHRPLPLVRARPALSAGPAGP